MKKVVLIFTLIFASLFLVSAAMPTPHAFKGYIQVDDGSNPNGQDLLAEIDGAITAQTTINAGYYDIVVEDNTGTGGTIEFYINGEKAYESFTFKAFEVTETNLTFSTFPANAVGSCGDGICAVEECSFCAIDCSVTQCNTNGVCNEAIGEDEVTAPEDCYVAPAPTPAPASGGGGGGGGGAAPATTNTNVTVNVNVTNNNFPTIDNLNNQSEENVTQTDTRSFIQRVFGNFPNTITGFTIRGEGNLSGTWRIAIAFVLLLAAFYLFVNHKRKIKKKKNTFNHNN